VWSDEKLEQEPKVIFPDQEDSTWAWDEEAGQFYLHRFCSTEPDLNIADPDVRDEIHRIMGFWLELGVSGFRVDAAPYLTGGTGIGNAMPQNPHVILQDMRGFLSRRQGDAVMFGEVNLDPGDREQFFGDDGDEMTGLFDFITCGAVFVALARGRPPRVPRCHRTARRRGFGRPGPRGSRLPMAPTAHPTSAPGSGHAGDLGCAGSAAAGRSGRRGRVGRADGHLGQRAALLAEVAQPRVGRLHVVDDLLQAGRVEVRRRGHGVLEQAQRALPLLDRGQALLRDRRRHRRPVRVAVSAERRGGGFGRPGVRDSGVVGAAPDTEADHQTHEEGDRGEQHGQRPEAATAPGRRHRAEPVGSAGVCCLGHVRLLGWAAGDSSPAEVPGGRRPRPPTGCQPVPGAACGSGSG
jgi:hypothetical protein